MSKPKQIWFPAKKYGWGWGTPCTWQGWVVLLGYVALITGAAIRFNPAENPLGFILSTLLLTALLLMICFAKGEKPKWRWGDDQ